MVEDDKKVVGVLTDGDIRRLLLSHGDIRSLKVSQVMRDGAILCPGHTLIPGLLSVSCIFITKGDIYIHVYIYIYSQIYH